MKKLLLLLLLVSPTLFAKTLELNENNTLSILGEIGPHTLLDFSHKLIALNEKSTDKPLYLYIDSPGGVVEYADAIVFLAKNSRRIIHTISLKAASAAFNIVQMLHTRYIVYYSQLLTHPIYYPNLRSLPDTIEMLTQSVKEDFKTYREIAIRLGLPLEDYVKLMEKDMWVRGENNLTINTADEIVEIECSKQLILNGDCQ